MCCQTERQQLENCGCGCMPRPVHRPRFMTEARKQKQLESYLDELKDEVAAVEAHIAKLKGKA